MIALGSIQRYAVYNIFYFKGGQFMNNFSKNLKQLRAKKGIRQSDLVPYLHCSPGAISGYENGLYEPSLDTLIRLADFYGVSVDSLLIGSYPLSTDRHSRIIHGSYTVSRFVRLLDHLSEDDRALLVYGFCLLEDLRISGQSF